MLNKMVTVTISGELYERLQKRAAYHHRSVAGELLALVQVAVPEGVEYPLEEPKTPEELGWPPGFFEQTAGALADDPIPLDADESYAQRLDCNCDCHE